MWTMLRISNEHILSYGIDYDNYEIFSLFIIVEKKRRR